VVGLGEAEAHGVAGEHPEHPRVDGLLDAGGERAALVEGVGGLAEDVLRDEVVAAAHTEVDRGRVVDGVDRDVAAGVAGTDHQHPLAREDGRRLVAAGVQHLAVEPAGEGGDVRLAEGAVGGDHAGVPGRRAARRHLPRAVAGRSRVGDLGAEGVARAEVEVVGEGVEVALQVAVRGVVGDGLVHRELGELRGGARGDQVGRLVDRAARGVDVPQPAHPGAELVPLPGDAVALEAAGRGQAGRAGADDRDGELCHGRIIALRPPLSSRLIDKRRVGRHG